MGIDVCFRATSAPPQSRNHTLYSSSKICKADTAWVFHSIRKGRPRTAKGSILSLSLQIVPASRNFHHQKRWTCQHQCRKAQSQYCLQNRWVSEILLWMNTKLHTKSHTHLVHINQSSSRTVAIDPGHQIFDCTHIFLWTFNLCALASKLNLCNLPVFIMRNVIMSVSLPFLCKGQHPKMQLSLKVEIRPPLKFMITGLGSTLEILLKCLKT